ncbi:MAG: hypothetical protein QGG40_20860, partial [Myxococcota bacterium]|nr:hypothetical protein [Myxococcota bacterium]
MASVHDTILWVAGTGTFLSVLGTVYAIRLVRTERALGPSARALRIRARAEKVATQLRALAEPHHQEDRDSLRRRLSEAGLRGRHALETFGALRGGLALGLPVLAFLALPVTTLIG